MTGPESLLSALASGSVLAKLFARTLPLASALRRRVSSGSAGLQSTRSRSCSAVRSAGVSLSKVEKAYPVM